MATQGVDELYPGMVVPNGGLGPVPPEINSLLVASYMGVSLSASQNMIPAGGAFSVAGAGPTYQANYATFNPSATFGGLLVPGVTPFASSGAPWSGIFCTRLPGNQGPAAIFASGPTSHVICTLRNQDTAFNSGNPDVQFSWPSNATSANTIVTTGSQLTFKLLGVSYSGSGVINAYDLTDDLQGSTVSSFAVTSDNPLSIGLDQSGAANGNPVDCAFFLWAASFLNFSTQLAIAASVRPVLAARGITTA